MREYILTELERKMIQDYLKKGTKTKDFTVLTFRIRKSLKRLREDMQLISEVQTKARERLGETNENSG